MTSTSWCSGGYFGRLLLTGKSFIENHNRYIETICDCGCVNWVRLSSVVSGKAKSCGCLRKEVTRDRMLARKKSERLYEHPLHKIHEGIIARCTKNNRKDYKNYGGRGIGVCDEWVNSFKSFYEWALKNGWESGLQIDRFPNNNGNYEPDNCRFATDVDQRRNKRNNVNITIFGETKCVEDWGNDVRCIVSADTFRARIKYGWDLIKALKTPLLK